MDTFYGQLYKNNSGGVRSGLYSGHYITCSKPNETYNNLYIDKRIIIEQISIKNATVYLKTPPPYRFFSCNCVFLPVICDNTFYKLTISGCVRMTSENLGCIAQYLKRCQTTILSAGVQRTVP